MLNNMVSFKYVICLFAFCTLVMALPGYGYFYENSSVPGQALGDVFYPGDCSSAFYNPCGIFYAPRSHVIASHYMLYDGGRFNVLGFEDRYESSAISIQGIQLYRDNIEIRQYIDDVPANTSSSQYAGLLTYSAKVPPLDVIVGGSAKLLYYKIHDVKSNKTMGVDLGISRKICSFGSILRKRVTLNGSYALLNFLPPKIKMETDSERYTSTHRISINPSLSLFPRYDIENQKLIYDKISVYFDYVSDRHHFYKYGVQYSFARLFDLRYGINGNSGSTIGFGLNLNDIKIDYAVLPREFTVLHFLAISYSWGDIKDEGETPEELLDYVRVPAKADRIYKRYLRDATGMIRSKNYDSAEELLEKIIPIYPENKQAVDMLELCVNSDVAVKINSANTYYRAEMNKGNYAGAYEHLLTAVDVDPDNTLTKQMFEEITAKELSAAFKTKIDELRADFVREANKKIDNAVYERMFDNAFGELAKLKLIEAGSENTFKQENHIKESRSTITDELVRQAVQYQKNKDFINSYYYLREAFRISGDSSIEFQVNQTREVIKGKQKDSLQEQLYQKKLYKLSAIGLSLDDNVQAGSSFFELKSRNPIYDYYVLEETLIKYKIIRRKIK